MDDQGLNDMLMRAFLLGIRVAHMTRGEHWDPAALRDHLHLLGEIAARERTLEDPSELATKCPQIAAQILRAGQIVVRVEQGLAVRIRDGFRDLR